MPLKLHSHPLSSYCWKVLIALHENGAPFEAPTLDLGDPVAHAAFVALWPTAKIPLLEDDGRIVPETSIQIEYLDSHYPGKIALLPAQAEVLLEVRLWDRLFDLYVMKPMQDYVAQLLRPEEERDAAASARSRSDLTVAYGMVEDRIGGRTWAAGEDFSMADCAAAPALFYAAIVQPFPDDSPRLSAYFERLMARPSVARVIVEARPFFQYFPLRDAMPDRFR
jgi:glutathione S-transferase